MDDTASRHKLALGNAAKERKRLSQARIAEIQAYEAKLRGLRRKTGESEAAFAARKLDLEADCQLSLAKTEDLIRAQNDIEHAAREELAQLTLRRGKALEDLEGAAYANRRAPIGEGIRLTEKDFQRAQSSVPLTAHVIFFVLLIVVVVAANAKQETPTWISVTEFLVSLLIAIIFGLRADHFARRADRRAEEKLREETKPLKLPS